MTTFDEETAQGAQAPEDTGEKTIAEICDIIQRMGYSTLTDAEIDRYVEWVSELRAARHEAVMRTELAIAQGEQLRDDLKKAYEDAHAAFERAMSIVPDFRSVEASDGKEA